MTSVDWQPLRGFRNQFESNLTALAQRDPALRDSLHTLSPEFDYVISTTTSRVNIAQVVDGNPTLLPNPVPAAAARAIGGKLYPSGQCTEAVLVAGLDQGWLWETLFEMPCKVPAFPGYTPPLYFLTPDLERLWCVLHLHDWREMLAHSRTRIFAGDDCVTRAQDSMAQNLHIPFPQLSVTIDPTTWPSGASLDTMRHHALHSATSLLTRLQSELNGTYAGLDLGDWAQRLTNRSRPLRVLGITSRFTTFLQYSMRDWLSAFEALGHQTHLLIEPDDCSLFNAITFSQTCAGFKPDLIVMIDRYRAEFSGLPDNVPWVMWIQDQLPHIFVESAGRAQKRLDYALGYGRVDCVYRYSYPSSRFWPAMVPTNESRFVPRRLTECEYSRFACDISFVSHCSTPAEVLLEDEIARQSAPQARGLLESIFKKLRARYDAGGSMTMAHEFRAIIDSSMREKKISTDDHDSLLRIFTHKINNALFRHQSLEWLAGMDVRIHLYGRGWENNPRFAEFARGVADNESDLSAIYQASRINLQVTPFGAAHQRVFDGLAAGGFFLLRYCDGDDADRIYRELWKWCEANNIRCDAHLRGALDEPQVRNWVDALTRLNGQTPFEEQYDFVTELSVTAASGFTRNASTLWNEYDRVVFRTREQLHERVRHFLTDDADRARIARAMRQRVLDRMTYKSVARETLELVRNDLLAADEHIQHPEPIAA